MYEPSTSGAEAGDAILADANARIIDQQGSSFESFSATWMLIVTWSELPSFIQQNVSGLTPGTDSSSSR